MEKNILSLTTLKQKPQLLNQVIELIEKSFNYSSKNSYLNDFYMLMNKDNYHNCWLLINNENELIGHIGIRECKMNLALGYMPIAMIGGIAISEEYRGQGIFSEFFNAIINKYNEKVALFILWSNHNELYQKFNFHNVGSICVSNNTYEKINNHKSVNYKSIEELDSIRIELLQKCYENIKNETATIHRSARDWQNLLQIKDINLYLHLNNDQSGYYFIKDKGFDLTNIVHEYGYTDENAKNDLEQELKNHITWSPEGLFPSLQISSHNYGFLIRIADHQNFSNFIASYSNNNVKINTLNNEVISFSFNNEHFEFLQSEFLQMILGPQPTPEFESFYKPIYISGLDSI